MRARNLVLGAIVVVVIAILAGGFAAAQERGGGGGQMRQPMIDRIKEAIQASDADWAALQPRIERIMALFRDANPTVGMGAMVGARGAGGPAGGGGRAGGGAAPAAVQTDVTRAAQALQEALANANSTTDEVTARLTALRQAREAAAAQLAEEQAAVRGIVNPRQEAQLVLLGILK